MRKGLCVLAAVIGGLLTTPIMASNIVLGISSNAQIGSNYIDFGNFPNGAPYASAPNYGTFEVSQVNSGIFQTGGVTTGEFGRIQSLDEGTGTISLPSAFMAFNTGGSDLRLFATYIPPGTNGMFDLTNTPAGAVLALDVDGYLLSLSNPTVHTPFISTLSATFAGETVAQVLSSLPTDTPSTVTFAVTAVPEPVGLTVIGAGLVLLLRRPRKLPE